MHNRLYMYMYMYIYQASILLLCKWMLAIMVTPSTQQVLKNFNTEHHAHPSLRSALHIMVKTAEHINTVKRQMENSVRVKVHVQCTCVYHILYMYNVHVELASHKRSSTHRPSSQGWASRCLVLCCWLVSGCLLVCFVVARLFVWVGGLGVFSFLFSLPSSYIVCYALVQYVHVPVHIIILSVYMYSVHVV